MNRMFHIPVGLEEADQQAQDHLDVSKAKELTEKFIHLYFSSGVDLV